MNCRFRARAALVLFVDMSTRKQSDKLDDNLELLCYNLDEVIQHIACRSPTTDISIVPL